MADHRRFIIDPGQIRGCEATLQGPIARQISKVLRLKAGDAITLLDGCGNSYTAEIRTVSPEQYSDILRSMMGADGLMTYRYLGRTINTLNDTSTMKLRRDNQGARATIRMRMRRCRSIAPTRWATAPISATSGWPAIWSTTT